MIVPDILRSVLDRSLDRLHAVAPERVARITRDAATATALHRLLLASDYALDRLCRTPELLDALDRAPAVPVLRADDEPQWPMLLRRYRHAESLRFVWRDVNGLDSVEQTLARTSALADTCTAVALDAAHGALAARHGIARDAAGAAQSLVVFGLGKQGGAELNFSSDIDLVFAYPDGGSSDGARPLDNGAYFQRVGQRLIQLLGDIDADGFAYRVDMRLRPFGQVGRLALSFAAMEQYFQREGRDWERYAWIKARPIAGDTVQGERLLEALRPFVYRRYLDYGAFEGLREMKAMIEADVARRELEGHLKLGRGGIREIEFIVQLQQLIRGGREPALRQRGLLPALAALRARGYVPEHNADVLVAAYRFLRRLENRVQMLREEQTHAVPDAAEDRARLAFGLGYPHWDALQDELDQHRHGVAREFERVFEARTGPRAGGEALAAYWRDIKRSDAAPLAEAGFADANALHAQLLEFARLPLLRSLSARTRARLDRVLPALLGAAARSRAPGIAAGRALALVQAVLRRSSYLALLDEQPGALARLVEVMSASAWMAERVCAHPLLLDDLLDVRADATPPTRAEVGAALQAVLAAAATDDIETRLVALNEFRQSFAFRIARATLIDRQSAQESARQLAFLAEAVIGAVLPAAVEDLARQHGRLPGGGLAAIAYGSFGGKELGFGSDLDLVFLYDAGDAERESDGARPLDAARYHARVVQKTIALLQMPTPAGRLYDADLRLRPDGAKGLLVSTLSSFAEYQRERAWTWEQQALVRARCVAGDAQVADAFARIREDTLRRARDPAQVRADVAKMRQRMRDELDRSGSAGFDLKQGSGGLVDVEFLLQAGVLMHAASHRALCETTRTPELIAALAGIGWIAAEDAAALQRAHAALLARSLACTLDGRARIVPESDDVAAARLAVLGVWQRLGFADASVAAPAAPAPIL
ncbi:bifunctional [glutamate--ammonia ligase]-adenylyl-L-tyrosine phosphorylase/[glutamate--ammonia-ligase] adenylyltransferase [Chiayiivirga flava]|uniref:Bifunctional glutamine synthetase adenylyltransferase/adenylyl-removing enzyme n=1 Tax=Chiayiivirga flava TaxID=659595 RepID=A0A7W8FZV0_9GAMM|nr:bifunctional [glutamate--ammonia ligase]-adenylyl-L-tyrosine phosphorylase/[glutamate--ammonia-ligase] adenylyltransferase [Chiayiivirga flava]MBB5207594.1 glutamate-ammonia-ligase adenylyltransferase [Chiayiivirga flava]